jgi:long-chain fatty acid transport protein
MMEWIVRRTDNGGLLIELEKRMRKVTGVIVLCLAGLWCLTLPAWGGGMEISGVGAKAKAMGGAFRAIADDWSAAYYNPAGLFYTTENQLTFNEVITHYRFTYTPNVTYGGYNVGYFDGKIYNRYKVLTNPTLGGYVRFPVAGTTIAAGLAIFQPFDRNISWQVFHPLNNGAALPGQEIEHNFDALAINLVSAVELMENRLSLGISAGVLKNDLVYGGFFLRPNPADPNAVYYDQLASRPNELITEWQRSEGSGFSPNLRAGLMFKATPKLSLGLTYAMQTKTTVDGESYFYYYMPDIPYYHSRTEVASYPDSINYILSSGAVYEAVSKFKVDVTLPSQIGAGVAYQVNDKLLIAGDLQYTLWSQFKGYHFDYDFTDTSITPNAVLNQWMVQDMNLPAKCGNAIKGSLGAQYRYSDMFVFRAGYSADQTPFDAGTLHPAFFDPGLKHSFNFGLGLVFENIILDFSTEYTAYSESTEAGNTDISANGGADGIVDNMSGTYGGSALESIVQFTVRF